MNQQKITAISVEMLLRYYQNDVSLFLEYMDKDVLWYGPADGQFLSGKAAMISAWAAEDSPLTFTVGDFRTKTVSSGPTLCVVVATYWVITHFPSGKDQGLKQRAALTWCERTMTDERGHRVKYPRVLLCNVTNPHLMSEEDTIYPVHSEQIFDRFIVPPQEGGRLHFRGLNGEEYYLFSDSVLWGESRSAGRRCLLHLADGTGVEVTMSVREIAGMYPSLFLRCHSSYFVNPRFVRSLRRFAVTMQDGTELPIPEKSYTSFKKTLVQYES